MSHDLPEKISLAEAVARVNAEPAILDRSGARVACSAGDVIYVPARMPHRFESHSNDFRTWVIYVRPHAEP